MYLEVFFCLPGLPGWKLVLSVQTTLYGLTESATHSPKY